ncbi:MAG: hypothetical protein HZC47_08565 [Methanobacterium sp.]|uniref:hypothetical protein n=1 Tax=Methanobacterium sp. TaxID=2164 RepID=UPI003D65564E|nr:hypothetical protein [Methanobacterium sp.]
MGVLKTKLKKYNKYVIELENDEIKSNDFENVEDIIISSKTDFEDNIQKYNELKAKLHSIELDLKLKELKIQEKDLETKKTVSKMHELEEAHKSEMSALEKKYLDNTDELKGLLEKSELNMEELKKEFQYKTQSLKDKLKDEETLQKQTEIYRIGNLGLKNDIQSKETEIINLKKDYNELSTVKSKHEIKIKNLQTENNMLKDVQTEYNKLNNNYRHLQEVVNKKDKDIIELEYSNRKLEQYLSMSLEAITTLKNLGLFNRLFNKIPEGIDELQEDIKKLQPPEDVEIDPIVDAEPVRPKKPIESPEDVEIDPIVDAGPVEVDEKHVKPKKTREILGEKK